MTKDTLVSLRAEAYPICPGCHHRLSWHESTDLSQDFRVYTCHVRECANFRKCWRVPMLAVAATEIPQAEAEWLGKGT